MDEPLIPVQTIPRKLPTFLTTVTPFSKFLAMALFIILPFVGFCLGVRYQALLTYSPPLVETVTKITPTPVPVPLGWLTYVNDDYGYKFSYPQNYVLNPRASETLLTIPKNSADIDGEVTSIFGIHHENYSPEGTTKSFKDYLVLLLDNCLADYPGRDYCDRILTNEPYSNSNGLKGFKVYLEHIHESGNPKDEPDYSTLGPIYVFESLRKPALIYLDSSYSYSSPDDEEIFKQVVNSLELLK